MQQSFSIRRAGLAATLALGALTSPAGAVVLHTGDVSSPGSLLPDVVGQWLNGSGGSAVAIAPNYVLASNHQGGGLGSQVKFGSTTYVIVADTLIGTADLRVAQIAKLPADGGGPADLTIYAPIYTGATTVGMNFVVGGFGEGRGTDLLDTNGANPSTVYGYNWNGTPGTRIFGENQVEGFATGGGSTFAFADFDAPGSGHEAAIADKDSGGGWFVLDAGTWKTLAINNSVEHAGRTIFRANSTDPDTAVSVPPDPYDTGREGPDLFYAVHVPTYAPLITAAVPEPASLCLLTLGIPALLTRRCRRN